MDWRTLTFDPVTFSMSSVRCGPGDQFHYEFSIYSGDAELHADARADKPTA